MAVGSYGTEIFWLSVECDLELIDTTLGQDVMTQTLIIDNYCVEYNLDLTWQ